MRPSRQSSPMSAVVLLFEDVLVDFAYVVITRVSERRKPSSCMPPSCVLMLLANGEDRLGEGGRPLHRDLDLVLLGLGLEVDDPLVDRFPRRVEVLDEVDDPAGVLEGLLLLGSSRVDRSGGSRVPCSGTPSRGGAGRGCRT